MKSCLLACLLVSTFSFGWSQSQMAPKKSLAAIRIQEQITPDANLDEAAWQTAPEATDFLFFWPTPGRSSTQRTVVKVIYDDFALYIGAYCYDTQPDSIFHRITKRDELENSDFFAVVIDTYRDGQNAVQFGVSPDNVQFDSKFSLANANGNNGNNDGEDPAWDAVWQSSARITADGWVAELVIPYNALRFPKKEKQEWGVNFYRAIKRNGENDSWNEIKADISGTLAQTGILTGIENIKSPLRLSATPFIAGYADNIYNQPGAGWNYPWSVGLDVKYGINEAFTLDATIIPDFGQVRSDQQVLNLSPFEVQFQENRPFFTEGTELFNKGGLFYSRRIGADSQLLNATKISGRTKKGLGIGIFNALEEAKVITETDEETGAQVRTPISPLTNNNILVLDQNLKNNSSITFINTNVMRSGAVLDANVSGLLFNLKNKAQSYGLNGKVVVSNRIAPENKESGYTVVLSGAKTSGNFLWGSDFVLESDRYNPNDLGLLFSPNEVSHVFWINYNRYKPWWKLNNYWSSLWMFNGALYQPFGQWTETSFGFNFGGNTRNFQNFGFNSNVSPWGENDYFEPRTNDFKTYYHLPARLNMYAWYNSDNRKRLTFYLEGGTRIFQEDGRIGSSFYTGIRWRASDKFTLGLNAGSELSNNNIGGLWSWDIHEDATGYEALPENPVVLGRRNIVGLSNSANVTYSFNTRMNLTLYARHYWQKAEYHRFFSLNDKGQLIESPYTGATASGTPLNDIAVNFFNIDLVYTWRFAPGSDILVVYKNGVNHADFGPEVRRGYWYHVGRLPNYEGSNSLSVKILYFLDFETIKKNGFHI